MLGSVDGIGAACGLIGMYLSYYAAVPSGTMIVLTGATVFVLVLAVRRRPRLGRTKGMDRPHRGVPRSSARPTIGRELTWPTACPVTWHLPSTLPTRNGGHGVALRLRGTAGVVYFYPAASTPGCTKQACDFRDSLVGRSRRPGIAVVGHLARQSAKPSTRLRAQEGLTFPLLSDPERGRR